MTQYDTFDTDPEGYASGSVSTPVLTAPMVVRPANRAMRRAMKRGYTEAEAAHYIGMSRSYLRQDRMNGPRENRTPGPRYIRVGKTIRYLRDDLDAWLESHRHDDAE